MTDRIELISVTPEQTRGYGQLLGESLRGGDVVALTGPLGAGKTQFVKGIATGLRIPADEPIVSPTFVLIREYVGRLKLYHIDAYRLTGSEDLLALGLDEMFDETDAVVAIEWADRMSEVVPHNAITVALADGRNDATHAGSSPYGDSLGGPADQVASAGGSAAATRRILVTIKSIARQTELAHLFGART